MRVFTLYISAPCCDYKNGSLLPCSVTNTNYNINRLDTGLAGENIDISSGTLSLRHVDVSIPGNFDIPVEFARTYQLGGIDYTGNVFGGWITDVPFITMRVEDNMRWPTFYTQRLRSNPSDACFADYIPRVGRTAITLGVASSWAGIKMNIPGQGLKKLAGVNSNSVSHPFTSGKRKVGTTADDWQVFCSGTMSGAPGAGIVAVSPKGHTYYSRIQIISAPLMVNG